MTSFGEFREVTVYAQIDKSRWPEPIVNALIRSAIRDYSTHFPMFVDTEEEDTNIACSADEQEYSLSAFTGIQTVLDVEYPFGEDPPDLLMRRDQDDPRGFEGLEVYAVRGFEKPYMLRLGEEPSAGEEIRLTYLADHTVPTTDTATLTVPDRHLDALVLFVQWKVLSATVNRLMTNPDPQELAVLEQLAPGTRLPAIEENARKAYEAKIAEYKEGQIQVGDGSIPVGALTDRWAQEDWA
jgi:hypothetical protein